MELAHVGLPIGVAVDRQTVSATQLRQRGDSMVTRARISQATLVLLLGSAAAVEGSGYPIAGSAPAQRPQGAPQIVAVDRSGAWYTEALHGVSKPYPYSLRFLENQGNWYTPFSRPGAPGRYDIRGWHQR